MRSLIVALVLLVSVSLSYSAHLGTFAIGDRFDEINYKGYKVSLIYRGFAGTNTLIISIISSPDNPIVPGGYSYLIKEPGGGYLLDLPPNRYSFKRLQGNRVTITKEVS